MTSTAGDWYPSQNFCPTCGRCPTCGGGGYYGAPITWPWNTWSSSDSVNTMTITWNVSGESQPGGQDDAKPH